MDELSKFIQEHLEFMASHESTHRAFLEKLNRGKFITNTPPDEIERMKRAAQESNCSIRIYPDAYDILNHIVQNYVAVWGDDPQADYSRFWDALSNTGKQPLNRYQILKYTLQENTA